MVLKQYFSVKRNSNNGCSFFTLSDTVLDKAIKSYGAVEQSNLIKSCFGDKVTNRAYNRIGEETRIARENQNLYTSNLKGGVSTVADKDSKLIPGHTFYGE